MAPSLATDKKILRRELAKFTDRTGVRVDVEVLPFDALYTRLTSAVATGRQPDVADIGNTWSATLQATGAFLPFDESALARIGGRTRFVGAAMSSTGARGRPPASIPLVAQSYGLFYNTKLFAAAGISQPPRTWSEFVQDAHRLTKPGQWGVGLLGASAAGNAHLAYILGRQHGANLFDAAGHPTFDTPGERAAIEQLLALMTTEKVINPSDAERSGLTDSLEALAQGRAAMVPFQSVGRNYFAATGFHDYAVAPLPVTDPLPSGGEAVRSIVAGTNIAVFKRTHHKDAALQLVRFLTSAPEQVALNEAYQALPVVTSAYDDPAFADPGTRVFADVLRHSAQPLPMVPGEGKMETVLGGAISRLWATAATGRLSRHAVADALHAANQQMNSSR
jgi:multiple sugar transport system substrate-binding protein